VARPKGYELNPEALQDLLELTGKSKSEVAELADFSLGALRDLEIGRRGASIQVVHRLAGAFRCRPGTLFPALTQVRRVDESAVVS
jgi:transcriptional regulator with XRE-family HTH domain